jgi:hypothetical protein
MPMTAAGGPGGGSDFGENKMPNHPNRNKTKYPPSLAQTWLKTAQRTPGNTKAEALRKLNEDLGKDYNQGRLYQWLSLEREPDRETRRYMLNECIGAALEQYDVKLKPLQLRLLAEQLS